MKRILLIHDLPPGPLPEADEIISLFPHVAYELTARGTAYRTLHDYHSERGMYPDQKAHMATQLAWLDGIDAHVREHVEWARSHRAAPARMCVSLFKYFWDELKIESDIVRAFAAQLPASCRLTYLRHASHGAAGDSVRDHLRNENTNWIYPLLELALRGTGRELELSEFKESEASIPNRVLEPAWKVWLRRFGGPGFAFARSLRAWKAKQKWRYAPVKKDLPVILALHAGSHHIEPVLERWARRGADVYLLRDGLLQSYRTFWERTECDLRRDSKTSGHRAIEAGCARAADALGENHPAVRILETECGLPVGRLALPYLRHSLREVIAETLCVAERFDGLFDRKRITHLAATNSTDLYAKGALIAAASRPSIRKVCVQHGIQAYEDRLWERTDLEPFDAYVASEPLSARRFSRAVEEIPALNCRVTTSAHYLRWVRDTHGSAGQGAAPAPRTVLYIPSKVYSYFRGLMIPGYSNTWYFEYQKRLMDFFATMPDITFIFKEAPTYRSMSFLSIIPYIRLRGYSNIRVGTGRVYEYFKEADRILVDRPLTAVFETAVSGRPFLCLMADFASEPVSAPERAAFGRTLQTFDSTEDAFAKISAFLKSDGAEYRMNLDISQDEIDAAFAAEPLQPMGACAR